LSKVRRLLIVGNPDEVHVGSHLLDAAARLGIDARLVDSMRAFDAPVWRRRMDWWMRGRRPTRLRDFSADLVREAEASRPDVLLTTGISPVDRSALVRLRGLGVLTLNFLTDDPWNPAHRAPWFMQALPYYDVVFSPRRANIAELEALEGPRVRYVRFAYAPSVHFPAAAANDDEPAGDEADVLFAGGADPERVAVVSALIHAGMSVALYGGYWDRDPVTRPYACGFVDAAGLRRATSAAKVSLCLVRHANRDGHSMRSFEIPAMGGCLLAEDTPDHRHLFGDESGAAVYFNSTEAAVQKARDLVRDAARRHELAAAAHCLVTTGRHTYADRLSEMLWFATESYVENRAGRSRTLSRV
jgi:spore maturation protein CgeB